jgi:hypothetical protein
MERAVARGKKRKKTRVVKKMGVDEKSAARGHKYLTVVSDLERGTVEYLGDNRAQRDEIPVALFERERASGEEGQAEKPSLDGLADGPGLGDQGEL